MAAREARVRRRRLGVAAIVLAVVAGATPAWGQGRAFSIDRVAVSITVHPDASLDVREAITFDFRGSHQAVYRVIPVRYPRGGYEFALRLDGVQVLDEQLRPLKTNVSYSGRYVRVSGGSGGSGMSGGSSGGGRGGGGLGTFRWGGLDGYADVLAG